MEKNEVKYYVRNNSNTTVTIPETEIIVFGWTYSYSELVSKPADWGKFYWNYYFNDESGKKVPANSKTEWRDGVKFYQRSKVVSNNIELTVSKQILLPNASAYVGSVSKSQTALTGGTCTMDRFVSVKSISATASTQTVGIVETGTANAYLVNTSNTASYYVRFTGNANLGKYVLNQNKEYAANKYYSKSGDVYTLLTSENAPDDWDTNYAKYYYYEIHIVVEGDYNYYIGILRPGQIVEIPMSSAGVVEMSMTNGDGIVDGIIEATGSYSASSLSAWNLGESSNVLTAFNTFFN